MTDASPTPTSDRSDGFDGSGLIRPSPPSSLKERLSRLGDAVGVEITPRRVAVTVVVALVVAGAGFVLLRPTPRTLPEASLPFADPSDAPVSGSGSGSVSESSDASSTTVPTVVLAHAAGAVVAPGVYQLPAGSRISDLVGAAGGPANGADLDRVNLAAPVQDGQQVYVPRAGEVLPAGAGSAGPDPTAPSGESSAGPVDINSASAEQLDELPGVGPAIADAIITHRTENGPFGSVDQLLDVPGIGDAKLAQLRDLVTV